MPQKMSGPVAPTTIYDVARRAGVSQQTVSRVINGVSGVAPATRQRVLDASSELDFTANRAARSLRTSHRPDVGLVVVADPDGSWRVPHTVGRRLRDVEGAVLVEFVDAGREDDVTRAVAQLVRSGAGVVFVVRDGQLT